MNLFILLKLCRFRLPLRLFLTLPYHPILWFLFYSLKPFSSLFISVHFGIRYLRRENTIHAYLDTYKLSSFFPNPFSLWLSDGSSLHSRVLYLVSDSECHRPSLRLVFVVAIVVPVLVVILDVFSSLSWSFFPLLHFCTIRNWMFVVRNIKDRNAMSYLFHVIDIYTQILRTLDIQFFSSSRSPNMMWKQEKKLLFWGKVGR